MNDIEFILKEDIKKKKQAGSGYRYKKNGSKSKKCSLPSDHLSKKEIEKMNGECKVYNGYRPRFNNYYGGYGYGNFYNGFNNFGFGGFGGLGCGCNNIWPLFLLLFLC